MLPCHCGPTSVSVSDERQSYAEFEKNVASDRYRNARSFSEMLFQYLHKIVAKSIRPSLDLSEGGGVVLASGHG